MRLISAIAEPPSRRGLAAAPGIPTALWLLLAAWLALLVCSLALNVAQEWEQEARLVRTGLTPEQVRATRHSHLFNLGVIHGVLGLCGAVGFSLSRRHLQSASRQRDAALERLQEQEHRLAVTLRSVDDLIFVLSEDGRFEDFFQPDKVSKLLSPPEHFLGKHYGDVLPPDVSKRFAEVIERLRTTGEPQGFDYPLDVKGRKTWWSARVSHLWRETAGRRGVVAVLRDITLAKRLEQVREALLSLQTRLNEAQTLKAAARTIFDTASQLWTWDAGFLELYSPVEDRFQSLLNFDQVEGQRREVDPTRAEGLPSSRMRRIMAGGGELELRTPDEIAATDAIPFGDISRRSAAIMSVPIRWQDQSIGVLSVQSYTTAAFNEADLETLQGLADHCGGAMERIRAEDARRESDQRFREIVEHSPAGYFRMDRQGHFVEVNQAWLRLHGYERPEEILGQHFSVTQATQDLVAARAIVERVLEGRSTPAGEFSRRCRDGTIAHHSFTVQPVRQSGEVVGLEGFLIDTTELRRAQEDYQMLFREMINGFALHEIILDNAGKPVDYRFLEVNPAFERLTGMKAAAVVGRTVKELMPETEMFWIETYGRVALTGESTTFEQSSTVLQRDFQISAFRPAPGKFACIFVDITSRHLAEEQVRKLFRAVEQSPASVVITNLEGRIEYVNRKFTELTGYSEKEALGQNPRLLKSGHTRSEDYRALWEAISAGRDWRGEFHNKKKNGELYWESATISPIRNGDGQITHYLAVKEDITERRQLEDQLRQLQKMEAVGQLAGGVAHDFNNILTGMLLHLGLMRSEPGLPNTMQEALHELEAEAQRAATLTRQLLLFSRRQTAQVKHVDLNALLDQMLKMLRRLLGETIVMEFNAKEGLPGIEADPGMIEQVIMNLAVNARDAMPKGGRLIVRTEALGLDELAARHNPEARAGRFVRLSVTDTGTGIAQTDLPRIFEPFFTTKEVGKGTGLGLATVFGIVKQHHGWLEVQSTEGQGTTFHVYLPALGKPITNGSTLALPEVPGGQETILVVEDEANVRRLLALILRQKGYQVIEAASGAAALELWPAHRERIDLLYSDMVMPGGLNGRELAERFVADKPGLKIIISSGYSAELQTPAPQSLNGVKYLPKPCEPGRLLRIVRQCLDGK